VIIFLPSGVDLRSSISQVVVAGLISLIVTTVFSGIGLFKDQKKTLSIILFIMAVIMVIYGLFTLLTQGWW